MASKLLIIGAGMATACLLQSLSGRDHNLVITVIGDERDCCYNRVMLSSVLAGEETPENLDMLGAACAKEAKFLAGTRASHIDLEKKQVLCDGGTTVAFDQLVIATGSQVARPPLDCSGIEGIREFRSLQDTRDFQAMAAKNKHAVVVGGGLLGLEAAHGLNKQGFVTTVLHRNTHLMNRQLDVEGGKQLQRTLERGGLSFRLGTSVASVQSARGHITGLELQSGEALPCDLLVLATGILPNTQLAAGAGLAPDRGIVVDNRMRTEVADVYAIGECSQIDQQCFGLVAPIREQAAVLAREILRQRGEPFQQQEWPTQLKISGIDIYSAGELDDSAEQIFLRDPGAAIYRRLVIRDNRLIGAALVGDKNGGTWYAELIQNKQDIADLRSGLMFGRNVAQAMANAAQKAA